LGNEESRPRQGGGEVLGKEGGEMPIAIHKQVIANASNFTLIGEGEDGEKLTVVSADGDAKITVSAQELADAVREYCREANVRFGARRQRRVVAKDKGKKDSEAAAAA